MTPAGQMSSISALYSATSSIYLYVSLPLTNSPSVKSDDNDNSGKFGIVPFQVKLERKLPLPVAVATLILLLDVVTIISE